MENIIEEIKSRIDIVDLISSYINLKKVGSNFAALCPFHSEKKPSFFVSKSRQIWKCFGCQKGGNIFNFLMEIEGIDFADAMRILARKAGIELKKESPQLISERKRLYEILEWATKFYQKQLESTRGKEVLDYLKKRGLSEASILEWRIGFSPEKLYSLINFLSSKKYRREEMEKAGLLIQTERGDYFERFRGRIIFPIFDLAFQVIGFGGRIFMKEGEFGKYINTPNTLLYQKNQILYGLERARLEIRKKDFAILGEGYMDTIMSHQAGISNLVAICGTGLTLEQLKILQRYTQNLYLCFDMDLAGESAALRGINLSHRMGFNLKVVRIENKKDPADAILEDPEGFKRAIEGAVSIFDFYFDFAFTKSNKETLEGKKEISSFLLSKIKLLNNEIEKNFYIEKLAKELKVEKGVLEKEMERIKIEIGEREEKEGEEKPSLVSSKREILVERLLYLLIKKPEFLSLIDETVDFFHPKEREILNCLRKKDFEGKTLSKEGRETFDFLILRSEVEELDKDINLKDDFLYCLSEMKKISIREKLKKVSEEIKEAEFKKDVQRIKALKDEFQNLIKQI